MAVYISGTFISMLLAYLSIHDKKIIRINKRTVYVGRKTFAFLSFIPLTFIMAVRYNVGTDFRSYVRMYTYQLSFREGGLNILNNILHNVSDSPQIMFIVTSIIICGCYFIAIYRESLDPVYSILLFVIVKDYFISMNGVRQYLAISIMLLSLPCIKNKQYIKSMIFVLAAMCFHESAIVIAALIVMYNIEIKPPLGTAIIAGTFLVSAIIKNAALSIFSKFGFYDWYFTNNLANKDGIFNWQYMVVTAGPFIILIYIYNKIQHNKNLKILYSGVLLSLILMSLSAVLPTVITRVVWYMNALIVLYLPEAMKKIRDKRIRLFANAITITLYTILAVRNIMGGAQDVLPYQTFWNTD